MRDLIPKSLERGLDLLQLASRSPGGFHFREATAKLGLPNVTVSRLLTALCGLEYLEHDAERALYMPGPLLALLNANETSEMLLRRAALPLLEAYCQETGHTSLLLQWTGRHTICLERLRSGRSIELQGPGHVTIGIHEAPWGIFFLPRSQWELWFQRPGREQQKRWYSRECERLEREGYTCGHVPGKQRISAPLRTGAGVIIGAVAAGGTIRSMSAKRIGERDGPLLAELAVEFARTSSLGSPWSVEEARSLASTSQNKTQGASGFCSRASSRAPISPEKP